MKQKNCNIFKGFLGLVASVLCVLITIAGLAFLFWETARGEVSLGMDSSEALPEAALGSYLSDSLNAAREEMVSLPKHFWINEGELPPLPNQDLFGAADNPASMQWLLDKAKPLLAGQDTLFTTETEILPGSKVHYYLDDSIMVIVWKENIKNYVYTIAEVKLSSPTQFIRKISKDTVGCKTVYTTTQFAAMLNDVLTCSADYYMCREFGIVVYEGKVEFFNYGNSADTCFVDRDGNLILMPKGSFDSKESAQKFVDENNIRFSLAFGPILIDNGVISTPEFYGLGEPLEKYPRTALGQKGDLHYLFVCANHEGSHKSSLTISKFASVLETFGADKFYTLDGGQTGAIALNDKQINTPWHGEQRTITDVIYFATAVPNITPPNSVG